MDGMPLQLHLLIVDDDDVDRERVIRLLARTPLRVIAREAASSADALTLVREHDFDCVVLDNQLGDATGAELLPSILRESRRNCPVIMITGAGNESLAVQALQVGAADYLTKFQLNPDNLSRAIRRALDHHRMREELDDLHQRLEQRVEAQAAAIRQSERDLRVILDHTPTGIGYWDTGLRNRFGNRACRRWLGIDPDRLPGRHLGEVLGAERLARQQARIDAVLRGESQFFDQDFETTDDGTVRHAQLSLHPDFDDDGVVRGFYTTINDVTAIKRAQARAEELAAFTEALFEHSPIGLGVFDAHGCCVKCNQALASLIGTDVAGLVGLPLRAITQDDVLHFNATAQATLADGLPRSLEVDLHTVFDQHLLAACALARVDREGRDHVLLAAQDITEHRRANDALVAARNAAEVATHVKSEFLANMSHEIRTPMNAIVGLSQLALEEQLPATARNFIERMNNAAQALMGLLDDVLDYSKIEAGQLRFEHLPFDIEQVVQRVVDLFITRIERKGLSLVVDLAPDLPRLVLGDPLRLSQVLNNLVGNAAKFTEQGQIVLSVRPLTTGAPAPGMLRFTVQDTGIGIDPAQRESLFDAFSQGDSSVTRRFGGSGLGLTICRRLVTAMHGSIGVDSVDSGGSAFWFTARLDPAPLTLPEDVPPTQLAGLRVLLVEPDARAAEALVQHLRHWGTHVSLAPSHDEALPLLAAAASAQGEGFDVVLADWPPGHAAAYAALVALQAASRHAPVLIGMVNTGSVRAAAAPEALTTPELLIGRPVLPATLRAAVARKAEGWSVADHPTRGIGTDIGTNSGTNAGTNAGTGHDTATGQAVARSTGAPAAALAGMRVLLVEDNETNQLVAQLVLERQGAFVDIAGDGAQAVATMASAAPGAVDAILMDLHMPVMDGLEATQRILALPGTDKPPIIGMTAAAMAEDRASCLAAGMVDFVTKPLVVQQLLAVLLHRTGRPHSEPGGHHRIARLPGFDLTVLCELLHDDWQLIRKTLASFAAQEANVAADLRLLLASGEEVRACRRLHDLRGIAGTVGASAVAQAAHALEQAVRQHRPPVYELGVLTAAMATAVDALVTIQ